MQVGSGRIPTGRPHKPHKSQPHAKPPRRSPTKNSQAWRNRSFVPGGINTKGQIADQRTAARRAEFSAQNDEVAQEQKAIPSWYEDYLKKLQGLQAQSTQSFTDLQSQASSLGESVLNQTPEGMKAQDSRNNIVKAIQGALLQSQGANTAYNSQMGAIAGARKDQRLGDLATAKKKLAKDKGDFNTTFTAKARQSEFENSLAAKQFGIKVEDAKTKRIAANKKPKPETTYDKEFSKQAAKYGRTPKQWEAEGSVGRAKIIHRDQIRTGPHAKSLHRIEQEENIKQAAKHGYPIDKWNALTPERRNSIIAGPGKKDKKDKKKELKFAPQTQQAQAQQNVVRAQNYIRTLKKKNKNISRHQAAKENLKFNNAPPSVLISAALDAEYQGHLSRETARRLHASQYKVTEIARSLGVPTFTEYNRRAKTYPHQIKKQPSWLHTILDPMEGHGTHGG